jgi:hypothetical protein
MEGRPDIWGIHWQDSMPFIPKEQVKNPDKKESKALWSYHVSSIDNKM